MRSIEEIKRDIAACQDKLADVRFEMDNFEPDEKEAADAYDDMLDECYGPVCIGQMAFCPSQVLRRTDPVAYYCGLDEFVDSEPIDRWSGWCDLKEREEELNDELTDLEYELEEAEEEAGEEE